MPTAPPAAGAGRCGISFRDRWRGGEFIDTPHKTLLGYAREFGVSLEDVDKQPGEVVYFFNGQRYSEAEVVDEYREFVAAMRDDLRRLSREPTADAHTDFDRALDRLSLAEYLQHPGRRAVDS